MISSVSDFPLLLPSVFSIHSSILLILLVSQPFLQSFGVIILYYLNTLRTSADNHFLLKYTPSSNFYFAFISLSALHLMHSLSCKTITGILVS